MYIRFTSKCISVFCMCGFVVVVVVVVVVRSEYIIELARPEKGLINTVIALKI